ncbi:MAG: uncharacterized protein QOG64_338 [Acidimicrobiaceae bacterium]|nr:uncharacterized protein [Acidimicrobiaceae bacterium]
MTAPAALLLAPGASATRDHSALVAIDAAVSADGVVVERIDLPRGGRAERLVAVVRDAAADVVVRAGGPETSLFLGGRSLGGRICSMAVAEGLPAAGLVLISYPLHPPGKPLQLRTEHLPRVVVPCLFVSGTRDAFATPAELEEAAAVIPAPVTHRWIEGGNHGLRGRDAVVAGAVREWLEATRTGAGD